MEKKPKKEASPWILAGVGFELVATVGFFVYGGYTLDKMQGTKSLYTLLGLFLGFGLGFYSLVRKVKDAGDE